MTLALDDTDRRILHLLQTDGKASIQEIAGQVALSTSPCWRRIKRMEEAGLITGYIGLLVSGVMFILMLLLWLEIID